MPRHKPIVHDLGEYGEVWDTEVLQELFDVLPGDWKLWRITRKKDQDTWRASHPNHRYQESRHLQTVIGKVLMIETGFINDRGHVL